MNRYIVAPAGQRDLQDIYDYVARDSIQQADRVLKKILKRFDMIADLPGIGHRRAELQNDALRVISEFSYLVIYDSEAKPIRIVRIIHGAMNLRREFYR